MVTLFEVERVDWLVVEGAARVAEVRLVGGRSSPGWWTAERSVRERNGAEDGGGDSERVGGGVRRVLRLGLVIEALVD